MKLKYNQEHLNEAENQSREETQHQTIEQDRAQNPGIEIATSAKQNPFLVSLSNA